MKEMICMTPALLSSRQRMTEGLLLTAHLPCATMVEFVNHYY